jgi:hypothetical protein
MSCASAAHHHDAADAAADRPSVIDLATIPCYLNDVVAGRADLTT